MTTSSCLGHIAHEGCGSSDALAVYAHENGTVDGFCWSCHTYVPHPFGAPVEADKVPLKPKVKKTAEEVQRQLQEISEADVADLPSRKLRASVLEEFGVKMYFDQTDGETPVVAFLPYTKVGKVVRYKARLLGEKKIWNVGSEQDVDLFGWELAVKMGARRLVIHEGEFDAIAAHRICQIHSKKEFANMMAHVSLINGAGSAKKDLARLAKKIRSQFKEIVLCFDDDEAGRAAIKAALTVFPEATVVILPRKDANECLMEGYAKAAYKALSFQAKKEKTSKLVAIETLHNLAKTPPKFGELRYPWPKLNELLRGIRLGEVTYLAAPVKAGKSVIVNEIAAQIIKDGHKVLMMKPEEQPHITYKMLAGAMVGKTFHDPSKEFDAEAFDRAGEMLDGKVLLTNVYQQLSWDSARADITEAAANGVKMVFLDPLSNLVGGLDSSSANTFLIQFAQDVAALASDLGVHVFLSSHLNTPAGGISKDQRDRYYSQGIYLDLGSCPHEMGGSIFSNQLAGSRGMIRSAHTVLGMLANKDCELEENIRNIRRIKILEERFLGTSGSVDLFYNKNTGKYTEL